MLTPVNAATLQTYTTQRNYLRAGALTLFVVALIVLSVGLKTHHQGCLHAAGALASAFVVAVISALIVQRKIANLPKRPAVPKLDIEIVEERRISLSPHALTEGIPGAIVYQHDNGDSSIEIPLQNDQGNNTIVDKDLPNLSLLTKSDWFLPLCRGMPIRILGNESPQHWVCEDRKQTISDRTLRLEDTKLKIIETTQWDFKVKVVDRGTIANAEAALNGIILDVLFDIVRSYLASPYLEKIYFVEISVLPNIASYPYWRNARPRDGSTIRLALRIIKSAMVKNDATPLIVTAKGCQVKAWIWHNHESYMIARVSAGQKEYLYRHYFGSARVDIFPLSWNASKTIARASNLFETLCHVASGQSDATLVDEFNALPNE